MKKDFFKENKKAILGTIIGFVAMGVLNNITSIGKYIISPYTTTNKITGIIYQIDTTSKAIIRIGNLLENKAEISYVKECNLEMQKKLDLKADEDIVRIGFENMEKNFNIKIDALASQIKSFIELYITRAKVTDERIDKQNQEYDKTREYWYSITNIATKNIVKLNDSLTTKTN